MSWKFIIIVVLATIVVSLLIAWWMEGGRLFSVPKDIIEEQKPITEEEAEAEAEAEAEEEKENGANEEENGAIKEEIEEEKTDTETGKTTDWQTQELGAGKCSIKHPQNWFYKSISDDTPGGTYEMLVNDNDIENMEQELTSNGARMRVQLGPNNSPGESLDSSIKAQKTWVEGQYPDAAFEEKTIDGMKVLVYSYKEDGMKVRAYYVVKSDATGFFTCHFFEDEFIETFDAMMDTLVLGTVGIYQ